MPKHETAAEYFKSLGLKERALRQQSEQQGKTKRMVQSAVALILEQDVLIADAARQFGVTVEQVREALFNKSGNQAESVPDDPLPAPYKRCPNCGKSFNTSRCIYCHTLSKMDQQGAARYAADRFILEMVKMSDANFRRSPGPERLG